MKTLRGLKEIVKLLLKKRYFYLLQRFKQGNRVRSVFNRRLNCGKSLKVAGKFFLSLHMSLEASSERFQTAIKSLIIKIPLTAFNYVVNFVYVHRCLLADVLLNELTTAVWDLCCKYFMRPESKARIDCDLCFMTVLTNKSNESSIKLTILIIISEVSLSTTSIRKAKALSQRKTMKWHLSSVILTTVSDRLDLNPLIETDSQQASKSRRCFSTNIHQSSSTSNVHRV